MVDGLDLRSSVCDERTPAGPWVLCLMLLGLCLKEETSHAHALAACAIPPDLTLCFPWPAGAYGAWPVALLAIYRTAIPIPRARRY